jgi:hypothetical protein
MGRHLCEYANSRDQVGRLDPRLRRKFRIGIFEIPRIAWRIAVNASSSLRRSHLLRRSRPCFAESVLSSHSKKLELV